MCSRTTRLMPSGTASSTCNRALIGHHTFHISPARRFMNRPGGGQTARGHGGRGASGHVCPAAVRPTLMTARRRSIPPPSLAHIAHAPGPRQPGAVTPGSRPGRHTRHHRGAAGRCADLGPTPQHPAVPSAEARHQESTAPALAPEREVCGGAVFDPHHMWWFYDIWWGLSL
jgi:hypothetical protein